MSKFAPHSSKQNMTQNTNIYCVIMAGGIGSRFWPLSRAQRPKQFLDILGTGKSLLTLTFERMVQVCPANNIFVVTNTQHADLVHEQLPNMAADHVLLEPMRRNTAPCIAYAIHRIKAENPNAVVIVAPSDHLILNEQLFADTLKQAIDFAKDNDALLTLGIRPTRPETGYGYIQLGESVTGNNGLYRVKTFTEKPDLDMAKVFFESCEFYWNSGIFVWSVTSIHRAFAQHLPEVADLFESIQASFGTDGEREAITGIYPECRNISIDYGIMEKADNVFVIGASFGWSDLGSWGALHDHLQLDDSGNAVAAQHAMLYESSNLMLNQTNPNKLVVAQGLQDYIVIDTDDVLLICRREDEQRIKDFVNDISINNPKFS